MINAFFRSIAQSAMTMLVLALCGCNASRTTSDLPPPEPGTRKSYVCNRAIAPILIDGTIGADEWAAAPWSDAFVDIEGARRPIPHFETRMKMLWDAAYLYIAADLLEPHVWATYDQRDMIVFHENDFEIFIDPDGDTRNYFEIEVNALGTIFDLFLPRTYIDGGPADHDWNCPGIRWAVRVEGTLNDPSDIDQGWTVEFAIPWDAFAKKGGMRCPPRVGDAWRINFSRVQWQTEVEGGAYRKVADTKEDNWVWSPQGVIDMHRPQRWGHVRFQ